jgi:hypothetical protein
MYKNFNSAYLVTDCIEKSKVFEKLFKKSRIVIQSKSKGLSIFKKIALIGATGFGLITGIILLNKKNKTNVN